MCLFEVKSRGTEVTEANGVSERYQWGGDQNIGLGVYNIHMLGPIEWEPRRHLKLQWQMG